jgi:hypothetical protein
MPPDDDFLDGCDIIPFGEPTHDDDIPWLVLIAAAIEQRADRFTFLRRIHELRGV